MKGLSKLLITAGLGLCATFAVAQSGWQQIDQPMYRLIFPPQAAPEAQRVAHKLDQYLIQHQAELPLDQPFKKIPIVLYTQSHISNGNVGALPYVSRWYNKPAAFSGLEWYDVLAVHEGRHMVQFNQLKNNSVGRFLNYAYGEVGTAGFGVLFLPEWYLEGDAVVSETTLTQAGRGRVASFDLWFRTAALTEPEMKYDRAMLGTGFDSVPYLSPYVLGYFLTGYLRLEYGPQIFTQVIENLTEFDGFTFDGSIKKLTGKNLTQQYADMVSKLRAQWQSQQAQLSLTDVTPLTQQSTDHWQSIYPVYADTEQVIAVQMDVEKGASLVSITAGNIETLTDLSKSVASAFYGTSKTQGVTSQGDKQCWIATTPHPTQLYRETGNLVCWSAQDGLKQLTENDTLTEVEMTHSGFLAHRFTSARDSELVWFNAQGVQQNVLPLPKHSLAHDINVNDHGITFVLSGSEVDGLYQLTQNARSIERLKAKNNETLRSPILTDNWLLFTSDQSGIDQLMAMSLTDKQVYQIATRPYGSYYLNWDAVNQRIVFADYQQYGQQLVSIPFSDSTAPLNSWLAEETIAPRQLTVQALVGITDIPETTQADYAVSSYSPLAHVWNPHSWGILYNGESISGFTLSNDAMDKLAVSLQGGYNILAEDWFGSVESHYRLDAGPNLNARVARIVEEFEPDSIESTFSVSQPFTYQRNAFMTLATPETGVLFETDEAERVFAALDIVHQKDQPPQAIETPFGVHQSLYVDVNTDMKTRSLSTSNLALKGFSARQALNVGLSVQYLESGDSLFMDDHVLPDINSTGLSLKTQADYRFNLGPVGKSYSPVLYWRNTEVSLNTKAQLNDDNWQTAFGVTLQPSINLLRNASILMNPSLSAYYLPETDETKVKFGLSVVGY